MDNTRNPHYLSLSIILTCTECGERIKEEDFAKCYHSDDYKECYHPICAMKHVDFYSNDLVLQSLGSNPLWQDFSSIKDMRDLNFAYNLMYSQPASYRMVNHRYGGTLSLEQLEAIVEIRQ